MGCAVAAAVLPASAHAAGGWRAPEYVYTSSGSAGPAVAVSPNGQTAGSWVRPDGTLDLIRRRPLQGVKTILGRHYSDSDSDNPFSDSRVAVNDQGDLAVVAWGSNSQDAYTCYLVARGAGPLPQLNDGTPTTRSGCVPGGPAAVAIDAARTVWIVYGNGGGEIAITRLPLNGPRVFTSVPADLGATGITDVTARAGKAGHALFGVELAKTGDSSYPRTAVIRADGSKMGGEQLAAQPSLALDHSDRVLYTEQSRAGGLSVRARALTYGGTIGSTVSLSTGTDPAGEAEAALDERGHGTVIWQQFNSATSRRVQTRDVTVSGGSLGSPVTLDPNAVVKDEFPYADPQLAENANGTEIAAWHSEASGIQLLSAYRRAGGKFVPTGRASSLPYRPDVAIDGVGNGWLMAMSGIDPFPVTGRDYDVVPPVLQVFMPPVAAARRPLHFRSRTSDRPGKGVSHVYWRLGDGKLIRDQAPDHTYDHAGTVHVRTIAIDEAGNRTTVRRTLRVVGPEPAAKPRELIAFGKPSCSPASRRNQVVVGLGRQPNVTLEHADIRVDGKLRKSLEWPKAEGEKSVRIATSGESRVSVKVVTAGRQKAGRAKVFKACA